MLKKLKTDTVFSNDEWAKKVIATILAEVKDGYALAYTKEWERMLNDPELNTLPKTERMSMLHCQVLYVINNLGHWRGEIAKQNKLILRDYDIFCSNTYEMSDVVPN